LIIDKKRRDKMKDKLCRYKEEGCCSYAGNKTTHQKSSTIFEDNLYRNRRQDEKDDENDTRLNDRNQTEKILHTKVALWNIF
jgi:hypothetical protein